MQIVNRNAKELLPAKYNPRQITGKELDELKESIQLFGMVEPIIVNMKHGRKNIIISGHQRLKACKELGIEIVPCIELQLDEMKEKQLNIRMNKAGGKFDFALLNEFFDKNDLINWGFLDNEFIKIVDTKEIENLNNESEAIYPIVPILSEKYDYVIIFSTNEIDNAYLNNYFNIPEEQSYKNSKIGIGKVVAFNDFKKIVEGGRNS